MKYLMVFLIGFASQATAQMDEVNPAADKIYKEIMGEMSKRNFSVIDSLGNVMYQIAKGENDPGGYRYGKDTIPYGYR